MAAAGAFECLHRSVHQFVADVNADACPADTMPQGWSFFAPLGYVPVRVDSPQVHGRVTVTLLHVHLRTMWRKSKGPPQPRRSTKTDTDQALHVWLAEYMQEVKSQWTNTMRAAKPGTERRAVLRVPVKYLRQTPSCLGRGIPVAWGPKWTMFVTDAVFEHEVSFFKSN